MKAFKNSNMFDDNHGPGGGSGGGGFHGLGAGQIPTFKALKEIKVAIISNLAREVSNNSSLDIRAIQNS